MSFFCWDFCNFEIFFVAFRSADNNLWWATLFFQVKFVRILKIRI